MKGLSGPEPWRVLRRGAHSSRAGRRAALLGMLTAAYANSSRGARTTDRTGGERS